MEKFKELVSKCKCSVQISVNDHKGIYQTVEQYINEVDKKEIESEILDEMIKQDTIIEVQIYPNTPISFYVIYHYDIDKAIEMALENVNQE